MDIAIKARVDASPAEAEARARLALEAEGFGVLTEIDVQAKMKERKLDRTMPPYKILGACAPALAWDGLHAQIDLGVLLPCNVCIYEHDGSTWISAMEPQAALQLIPDDAIKALADEVSSRLRRVVEQVAHAV